MEAFRVIARFNSFTRAAQHLHITQSGLSAMTRTLEEQFGTRLFDRTTRTVSLTPAGCELLPAIERMLSELEEVQGRVSTAGEKAAQQLTVAATPLVASSLMPSVLAAFDALDTGVTVKVRDPVGLGSIQALVAEGDADLGVGIFRSPFTGVISRQLLSMHLVAAFKPGTLKCLKPRKGQLPQLPWSRLRDLPILTLSIQDSTQQLVASHLAAIGHAHRDSRTYDSLHTMIAMAATGYGVAVIPSFALAACVRYGAEFARMVEPTATINWSYCLRKGSPELPAIPIFLNTLLETAKKECCE